jgi:hypothetical protein
MRLRRETPSVGLVVRFDYLWKRESQAGKVEGAKVRPCAVVVPIHSKEAGFVRVILAGITYTPPINPDGTVEIPANVKHSLGVDDERSWIVTSGANIVDWSDAGFEPVSSNSWCYGELPKSLAIKVRDGLIQHSKMKTFGTITRSSSLQSQCPHRPSTLF